MKYFSLLTYTFSHFIVDYICIFTVINPLCDSFGTPEYALGIVVYNFLAFGLQMLIGSFCDEKRSFPSAAVGCFLVLFGGAFSGFSRWSGILLVGIGNAFFHVGGGMDSLINSGGKIKRSGIFVSSGALGVALAVYNSGKGTSLLLPLIVLAICGVLCFIAQKKTDFSGDSEINFAANKKYSTWIIIILALVSVLIRSFGGTIMPADWKTTEELILLSGVAAFGGKFIGGFAADFFGAKRTGVISLLLSGVFIGLGTNNAVLSLIGILLFNITMPITLCIIAEKLKKSPGTAFGLTTAALLLGAVPSFFIALEKNFVVLAVIIIISAGCIFFSADKNKAEVL